MGKGKPSKLRINPDFTRMVAPLPLQARRELEQRLLQRGCSTPIRVWGNTVLVDQEAYLFCRAHHIPITATQLQLRSQEEAIAWICRNQYAREDLSMEMRKYLIGKRFHAERALGAHEAAAARHSISESTMTTGASLSTPAYEASATRTCERIGIEYHISFQTVRKYGIYAGIIDRLYSIEPAMAKKILRGDIKISHENLVEVNAMNTGDILRVAKYYLDGNDSKPSFSNIKAMITPSKPKPTQAAPGSIKEMPEYDPDAEVASLALTVPSWISSIHRTQNNSDLSKISERARERLIYELDSLVFTVEGLLSVLKEDYYG